LIADNYEFNIEKQDIWKVKIADEHNVLAVKCPRHGRDCSFDRESPWAVKGTWDVAF
jgi:hypothetical protein